MEIERINTYNDFRFSETALRQHGCFLVDGAPYEIEIIAEQAAVVRGREISVFPALIEEFRFYTPHITLFYDCSGNTIKKFPEATLLTVPLNAIQPSQFFVDEDKIAAIREFITTERDIIIQVLRQGDRYISLDGHTRLYYAVIMGWTSIRAVEETSGDYIYGFVEEAQKRGIHSPYDMTLLSHADYEIKWNQFCDDYFAGKGNK